MAYSKISLYKQNSNKERFVVVYYRHGDATVRHRTTITVKEKDFDKKTEKIKSTDPNADSKNEVIIYQHKLVEHVIEEFLRENGIKPSSDYVNKQLESGVKLKQSKLEADLLECYDDFLQDKKVQFSSPERSTISLKDYTSTNNALKDYQQLVGSITPLDINDRLWLDKFNTFLSKPRPQVKGYRFLTKQQNDKTRDKRFGVLKNFGTWLLENGYLKSINEILSYKIKVVDKDYYTPTLEEIGLIQDSEFKSPSHEKAIDMFIVACHTGVRYGDIGGIKKSRIKYKGGLPILILNNQKTKEKIEVPLTDKVMSILEKYEYNLNLMTDQSVNKYLHEALATIGKFREEYEYGTDGDSKPIYDLITFHTGRRAFITNLVNHSVSLNAIMKMTGHKKIATLQKYINPDYELMMDNVKIFNNL
jgi:integrase